MRSDVDRERHHAVRLNPAMLRPSMRAGSPAIAIVERVGGVQDAQPACAEVGHV
jgi:hypothetical protein